MAASHTTLPKIAKSPDVAPPLTMRTRTTEGTPLPKMMHINPIGVFVEVYSPTGDPPWSWECVEPEDILYIANDDAHVVCIVCLEAVP